MIRLVDLRKAYGTTVALDGVSLEVTRGEAFGLLGPNGAGKTTLMHLLVGVLKPDAGTIDLNGQTDPTRPEARRQIGIAPQATALYDDLSAAENLTFFGKLYGLSGSALKDRVSWCLDFAGLTERGHDRVKTYSGGMKRRLNLACALIHEPAVVLLDEPTVGVDPQSRNHLLERIEQLVQLGRTVVYTTHYVEEAQRLCRRVAIIDNGKIVALDKVDNLLASFGGQSLVEAELETPPVDGTLPGTVRDLTWSLETTRPLEELTEAKARGVRIASFRVTRPNLETVFLALTGRRLRDE